VIETAYDLRVALLPALQAWLSAQPAVSP